MPVGSPFVPPDVSDAPFRPDLRETVLDVPVPPSVNEVRRVNWTGHRKYVAWKADAGKHLMANGQYRRAQKDIPRYELTIILNERLCRFDQDNPAKAASDFLKSINIIVDDAPQHCRRTVIEWGDDETAPEGCRLIIRALGVSP